MLESNICSHCGHSNPSNLSYCEMCGNPLINWLDFEFDYFCL
ncbi:MAG: zinc-ribbon domain-containing protein [bacterium]